MVIDIELMTPEHVPFIPDMIWASFDCTTYSIAGIGHHRQGIKPISEYAKKSDQVNQNAIRIIHHFLAINPAMKFYIENPRGMLRKMPFMKQFDRATVWYCRYGDFRAKPTDIWSNNIYNPMFNQTGWKPRPECWNNNRKCHHDKSPRGSGNGTSSLSNAYERSKIPEKLCNEIIKATATS